jgi:hypothetical protein
MAKKSPAPLEAAIDDILSARDAKRDRLAKALARGREETIVEDVIDAFARRKNDRGHLPWLIDKIHDSGGLGAKEALRRLLFDPADIVRHGVAMIVEANRWGDEFLDDIRKLVVIEIKKGNRSGALGPALDALSTGKSAEITPMLLSLARMRAAPSWVWYGGLLRNLGDRRTPSARPIFEKAAKARRSSRFVKLMAAVGLAQLGDRDQVDAIRRALDDPDLMRARSASMWLHLLIGTPRARNREQFASLARWYDSHPAEVTKRFRKRNINKPKQ